MDRIACARNFVLLAASCAVAGCGAPPALLGFTMTVVADADAPALTYGGDGAPPRMVVHARDDEACFLVDAVTDFVEAADGLRYPGGSWRSGPCPQPNMPPTIDDHVDVTLVVTLPATEADLSGALEWGTARLALAPDGRLVGGTADAVSVDLGEAGTFGVSLAQALLVYD